MTRNKVSQAPTLEISINNEYVDRSTIDSMIDNFRSFAHKIEDLFFTAKFAIGEFNQQLSTTSQLLLKHSIQTALCKYTNQATIELSDSQYNHIINGIRHLSNSNADTELSQKQIYHYTKIYIETESLEHISKTTNLHNDNNNHNIKATKYTTHLVEKYHKLPQKKVEDKTNIILEHLSQQQNDNLLNFSSSDDTKITIRKGLFNTFLSTIAKTAIDLLEGTAEAALSIIVGTITQDSTTDFSNLLTLTSNTDTHPNIESPIFATYDEVMGQTQKSLTISTTE